MQNKNGNLFMREDTLFGVCEGLGEDFGFNPNWLRVAFAPLLFFSWQGALALYVGLGLLVFATRWFVPNPRPQPVAKAAEPGWRKAEAEAEALPLAA